MAIKQFYHDIDLVKVGQLQNARVQNVADAAALAAITTPGVGQIVYQVNEDKLKVWNGSAWVSISPVLEGDVVFKGTIDASITFDSVTPAQPQPIEAVSGYQYIVTTAGTLSGGATTITFTPSAVVEAGDVVLFTSATEAVVIQRNVVAATTDTAGIVELATTAEAITGTDATTAVTPAALAGTLNGQKYTRQYSATVASVAADTPATVAHNLGLATKDAFVINVMASNGSQISVDVDSVDANNLTITSSVALTNIVVTVIGAAA